MKKRAGPNAGAPLTNVVQLFQESILKTICKMSFLILKNKNSFFI